MVPTDLLKRGASAVAVAAAAARQLTPRPPSPVVACPVCGTEGSPYHPHPFKTWADGGRDDDGTDLRRCRRCGAEVSIERPWGALWWRRPPVARLVSREPRLGKGRARRRRRRQAARGGDG